MFTFSVFREGVTLTWMEQMMIEQFDSKICLFHDYVSGLSRAEKRGILEETEGEVIAYPAVVGPEGLESPDRERLLRERERIAEETPGHVPISGDAVPAYARTVNSFRRNYGINAPQVFASALDMGERFPASLLREDDRYTLGLLRESGDYVGRWVRRWALDPENLFLVRSPLPSYELQSHISTRFPCVVVENAPLECYAPELELSNFEQVLQATGIHQLWTAGRTGYAAEVLVLDTGLSSSTASDLRAVTSAVPPLDPIDIDGHGSTIARIIREIAPDAKIESIRMMRSFSDGNIWGLMAALTSLHSRIKCTINVSLGVKSSWMGSLGPAAASFRESLTNMLDSAASNEHLTICASGNHGVASLSWPSAARSALAVGSHNNSYLRSSFCNHDSSANNFILAPGGEEYPDHTYDVLGHYGAGLQRNIVGTSFSAAITTGVSALLQGCGWFDGMAVPSKISLFRNHCRKNSEGFPLLNVADIGAVWPI